MFVYKHLNKRRAWSKKLPQMSLPFLSAQRVLSLTVCASFPNALIFGAMAVKGDLLGMWFGSLCSLSHAHYPCAPPCAPFPVHAAQGRCFW